MAKGMYWHPHHDKIVEYCWDYEERTEYIRNYKPEHEIETRLRLFQPVKGKLPDEVVTAGIAHGEAWIAYDKAQAAYRKACVAYYKAGTAYNKARDVYDKAEDAYDKAEAAYRKALSKHMPAIEALHAKECGCKEWNGKEIVFAEELKQGSSNVKDDKGTTQ